jgi:ABC-type multidrug transport system ATPase subunit
VPPSCEDRNQAALDNVSLTVEPGTVTGLLGRNGAGKTTLLRIITGLEFPTTGEVKVFGAAPAENDAVLRRMVFVREEQAYPDFRVGHAIRVASWFYPMRVVVDVVRRRYLEMWALTVFSLMTRARAISR